MISFVVDVKMPIKFDLNKPDNRYIAGELLQGSVTLTTTSEEKVRCKFWSEN